MKVWFSVLLIRFDFEPNRPFAHPQSHACTLMIQFYTHNLDKTFIIINFYNEEFMCNINYTSTPL